MGRIPLTWNSVQNSLKTLNLESVNGIRDAGDKAIRPANIAIHGHYGQILLLYGIL